MHRGSNGHEDSDTEDRQERAAIDFKNGEPQRIGIPSPAGGAAGGAIYVWRRRAYHLLQPARGRTMGTYTGAERCPRPLLRVIQAFFQKRNTHRPRSML